MFRYRNLGPTIYFQIKGDWRCAGAYDLARHIKPPNIEITTQLHNKQYNDKLLKITFSNNKLSSANNLFNINEYFKALLLDRQQRLSTEEYFGIIEMINSKDTNTVNLGKSIVYTNFSYMDLVEYYPSLYRYMNTLPVRDGAIESIRDFIKKYSEYTED